MAPLSAAAVVGEARSTRPGNIGWLFALGHGHYTQFLNFRECFPEEREGSARWIGLEYATSGDPLSALRFVPFSVRLRRNVLWHARNGLAARKSWDALFLAVEQASLRPIVARHRSYLYTDLTPSLKRELAPWYDHQLSGNRLVGQLRTRYARRLYRAARGVFTMSEWSAGGVRRDYGVDPGRVHVSLPGANLRRWHHVDRHSRSGPVRVLMIGGDFHRKGGNMLLDWAETTAETGWELDMVTWPGDLPAWAWELLGRPAPDQRVSASLAPRLPNVRIHCGLQANGPEIGALLEAADVFCLPTMADGSSIASLEAMATGLPVLVGAVGGIPELIEDCRTGFLLRPGDAADLADKLGAVLRDPALRHTVGAAARRACEEHLNVGRQVRDILAVIDREQ